MAVVFADPFGSYIDGFERGQQAEMDYQEHAINTFAQEMELLDDLVLSPQRELAKEQRQYARQLDLMVRRDGLARQRQEEGYLLRNPGGTSASARGRVVVNGDRLSAGLGGRVIYSEPGAASFERDSLASQYNLGAPVDG